MIGTIGFIGLGIMGRPMALNLLQGGFRLRVSSRRRERAEPLEAAGAVYCPSPREAAAGSDIIFTMVSDTKDVEEVILGKEGAVHGTRPGSVIVDMSTISPQATVEIEKELARRGIEMLDAPVSGGETGAIGGTLSIMVGGKEETFGRVKPLFDLLGKKIVHIGKSGAGQVAKACNQIIITMGIYGVAEAYILAGKNGLDPAKTREALLGGFAASRILEFHGKRMLDRDFRPGFRARLHQKDLGIVVDSAHKLGLALPGVALGSQLVNALVGGGDGELDCSALIKVLERLNP